MDDFLSGFASNLTHLHLSRDTYSKITDPEGSWVDSLPLSMLASLEILQFEVDDSGQLLNWSWSIFSIGCLFFRWLAKELLNVHPRSALSQIILDLNNVEYSPPFFEVQVWGDLDQRLGVDSSLPHFERFRLRLNRPSSVNISEHLGWLQAALPLCAAKGFLTVERWRDPKAMINSAIQESCSDVV
ncbi:hypothetical protein DL96DRAFT_1607194 [Flagelloscypha sp. PMI_526]|nr:hypothetical protein DL96DRAFT_1607194 [Flagelloscypha sp. PMI_526]